MESTSFLPNLKNILEQNTLKWIFVGGKGGVGKTTISTSLSILLSHIRQKVLIISTDPAHNLSDAFNQKIGTEPTLINGYNNLYAIEIDPKREENDMNKLNDLLSNLNIDNKKDISESLKSTFPGVDEALNLKFIGNLVTKDEYDVVIFDTAPTGHTLRLLSMPEILGKTLTKLLELKTQFNSTLEGFSSFLGEDFDNIFNKIFPVLQNLSENLTKVSNLIKDPEKTTFIAVCIPEFLPVYETERLINELMTNDIDVRNVVINQVLMQNGNNCRICQARMKIQEKYINQIKELFEDFHITYVPLQKCEIRGVQNLDAFYQFLIK